MYVEYLRSTIFTTKCLGFFLPSTGNPEKSFACIVPMNETDFQSTRSTIGNNTRRNKRSPTATILPRHGDIIVSLGSIRAVVGVKAEEQGWIFDAHTPALQLFAQTIGVTFAIHHHQKMLNDQRLQLKMMVIAII